MRRLINHGGKGMIKSALVPVLIGLIALVAPMTLQAEIKLRDYETMKESKEFKIYISGVGRGYYLANASLEYRRHPKLFCPPVNPAVDTANYVDILAREIQDNEKKNSSIDLHVETMLLEALKKMFPCEKQVSME
jgi:hypothetical protein